MSHASFQPHKASGGKNAGGKMAAANNFPCGWGSWNNK